MNETEDSNQLCPECGYPAQVGHSPSCERNPLAVYDVNYIQPAEAEGPDKHEFKVGDLPVPVSFHMAKNGRFKINGLAESGDGVIISGISAKDQAKINHIFLAEHLRGAGLAAALLAELEEDLRTQGVQTVYPAFYNTDTVEFFMKNGYEIIPFSSMSEEQKIRLVMDEKDFDQRVVSRDVFLKLKSVDPEDFKKILLAKKLNDLQ